LPLPTRRLLLVAALLVLAVAAGACSGDDDNDDDDGGQTSDGGNVFGNGGFEDGRDPWYSLKPPDFEISSDIVHSGSASAALPFTEPDSAEGNSIYYLVQETSPDVFPEYISGSYFVDSWEKGTEKMYLQFVVIVFNSKNLQADYSNHQIRYILSGIKSPPFAIANADFVFLTREEPVVGEWVDFSRNLADDFKDVWGNVPEGFDSIRVLFEVRYDDKLAGEGPIQADVYYDDLYMGPAPADAATTGAQ
jgi:hypothetical protein